MNYETKTYVELAVIYEDKHGISITPEALAYRVKKGLSKRQAVLQPKSKRGKTSPKKKLRVGRKTAKQKNSGLEYVYLHIDVAGTGTPPVVRYVGKGQAGRCMVINSREKPHQHWLKHWFRCPDEQVIEMGISPAKLKDLTWIDLFERQRIILVSHPFEGAEREETRLINLFNTNKHRLFNKVLFTSDTSKTAL